MKVLFTDDDPILHGIIKLWLTRHGHEMDSASNGVEALQKLAENRYDVLISDVNMPQMSGIELVQKILQNDRRPALIIVLTSRCDLTQLKEQVEANDVHLCNKPFSPQKIIDLIETLQPNAAG